MSVYVSNINGDWWEVQDSQTPIWILDTTMLSDEQLAEVEDGLCGDKFEYLIQDYGRKATLYV